MMKAAFFFSLLCAALCNAEKPFFGWISDGPLARAVTTTTAIKTTTTKTTTTKPTTTTTTKTTTTKSTTTTTTEPACNCGGVDLGPFFPRQIVPGQDQDQDRIVGGAVAPPHSIPYQVGVWHRIKKTFICGGTLISPNFVITAAHCLEGLKLNEVRVVVGDVSLTAVDVGEKSYNVNNIRKHDKYNAVTKDFDIGLLLLAISVPRSQYVDYACLPTDRTKTYDGQQLLISGWGAEYCEHPISELLRYGIVYGINSAVCNITGWDGEITSNMICAGTSPLTETDACMGDDGGPLVADVNGKAVLVGVTSFGMGCAGPSYPRVYASVTAQLDWILKFSDAGKCHI